MNDLSYMHQLADEKWLKLQTHLVLPKQVQHKNGEKLVSTYFAGSDLILLI